jgi:ligand-binding SRPBCC domain-containing protein
VSSEQLLEREQRVELDRPRTFALYADALNLEAITPPWLHFRVVTPGPIEMGAGTRISYRLRLHGIPVRWQTRIETWEPPRRFVDLQIAGPYAVWHHTHEFEPDAGGTVIRDRVRYRIGYGPLGELALRLFVRRDLERIFDYRAGAIAARIAAHEDDGEVVTEEPSAGRGMPPGAA